MLNQQLQQENNEDQATADIATGKRVLEIESAAINSLAVSLDREFADAVDLLAKVQGRVVITGMGKSGHIGRKIAATMASTGTPAQFVHPGEASHGDMGMITGADAILALSNSGETQELSDLLHYSRRYGIPLIAITSRKASTLAETSDVAIILADAPEAGAIGLAPTTSTTMALAIGDALSIALLERKGFSAQDFHILHPGGKLGRQLMRMKDIMHPVEETPLCDGQTIMRDAILIMAEKRFGCIGATGPDGSLNGIVTDGDLRRHIDCEILSMKVEEIMTRNPITTAPDILAAEVISRMNDSKIGAIFVVEDGKPVGIAHLHDFLHAGIS